MFKKQLKKIKTIIQKHKNLFLLCLILLLGLGLRLINIQAQPYWADELLSLQIAKHYLGDLSGLWGYLQLAEVHPPLYYILIQIWGGWFGFAEVSLKSLSLIFSLGTIILVYWLGIILFNNKKIGLLAAFLTAILPMQIEFGQEARPYAIFTFLGILSLIILFKYFKTEKTKQKKWLVASFVITSIIGLYLHYSYMLILITLAAYWLVRLIINKNGREFIWWLITMAIIYLGFYAWLPGLIFKSFLIKNIVPESTRIIYEHRSISFFADAINKLIWASKEPIKTITIVVTILIKISWVVIIIKLINNKKNWLKQHKESIFYLIFIIVFSIILFLIFPNSTKYTTLMYRHILFDLSVLALLLAAMFIQINPKPRMAWLTIFIISLIPFQANIIGNDANYDINYRFKIIVDYINQNYQKGDLLLCSIPAVRPQLNYYLRKDLKGFQAVLPDQLIEPGLLSSRQTMGIIENETQLSHFKTEWPKLTKKINYLIKKYHAQRVWVIHDSSTYIIRKWFVFNGWRVMLEPIIINNRPLFPVTLYVSPKYIRSKQKQTKQNI